MIAQGVIEFFACQITGVDQETGVYGSVSCLAHFAKKAVLRSEGIEEATIMRLDEIIAIVCLGQ